MHGMDLFENNSIFNLSGDICHHLLLQHNLKIQSTTNMKQEQYKNTQLYFFIFR